MHVHSQKLLVFKRYWWLQTLHCWWENKNTRKKTQQSCSLTLSGKEGCASIVICISPSALICLCGLSSWSVF